MWLYALYVVAAEEQGVAERDLQGTTQNDIIKEYLSRGTYIYPPRPSLRLITDMIEHTVEHAPQWNPMNICSYHLQEAGATPVQEIAFSLCTAIAVLDAVRDSGRVPPDRFGDVVARMSFFVNAGVRFIEEMAKMRTFVALWEEITPFPIRRTGEFTWAHRGATREQRAAYCPGDVGGHAVQGRAGQGHPIARVE